jgi:stage III sporulation protein AG
MKDWIFRTDEYICDLRTVGVLVRDGKLLVQRDRDGSEYALVTKELMPEICGVVVACKGADEVSVKNSVIQAVSTVLGVGTNKVCVITKS